MVSLVHLKLVKLVLLVPPASQEGTLVNNPTRTIPAISFLGPFFPSPSLSFLVSYLRSYKT